MATSIPIAVRSGKGINIRLGPPSFADAECPPVETPCRTQLFSPSGDYFAYVAGSTVKIVKTDTWEDVAVIEGLKAYHLAFSPKGTYFMTWEPFIVNQANPQGNPNLNIYRTENGELLKSFIQKKQIGWEPQWSADEKLFSKVVNTDVLFYEDLNFERIVARINSHKVLSYSLSPNVGTYFLICHTSGSPGQPSFGRLFKYPNFEAQQSIANRSFFQADKLEVYWNSKGNNALLLTSTDVDKTGGSYYGKQTLHFVGINGQASMVAMSKEGPIYSVEWSPKNQEFCVIYGYTPAKATIFNQKCEPVFELGTGPRNSIYYNPQGNILLIGGFGNLNGLVEIWDANNRKQIATPFPYKKFLNAPSVRTMSVNDKSISDIVKRYVDGRVLALHSGNCQAADTTLLRWAPDGTHFLTATTSPRLRIGNGYKIWHYSGALLYETQWNELYDICWKPYPKQTFKDPIISYQKVEGIASAQPQASKEVYRPPSARNRPPVTFKIHDDEPAHKPGGNSQPSKSAMKNKKKREAKKTKKQDDHSEHKEADSACVPTGVKIGLTGDPEVDKKLRNLKKKLDAIEKLKEQQAQGKTLEINQLSKIKGEADLLKELQQLTV